VTRSETRSEGSRKRAVSSATSSGNDTHNHTPLTPVQQDSRRASLRGDESYFPSATDLQEHKREHHREPYEHPLAQSLAASPDLSATEGNPFAFDSAQKSVSVGATPKRERVPSGTADPDARPGPPDRTVSAAASIQTVFYRGHSYSRSVNSPMLEEGPGTPGPFADHHSEASSGGYLWNPRGRDFMAEIDEGVSSRARSVDRNLFESDNKHAEPSVAMSTATAPGLFQHPVMLKHPRPASRSSDLSPTNSDKPLASPLFFQPYMIHAHQTSQSSSTASVPTTQYAASNLDQRPSTANRTPEGKTPEPRVYGVSTPESFQRAQETLERRRKMAQGAEEERQQLARSAQENPELQAACPPSPDDEVFLKEQEEAKRAQSSSSVNSNSVESQLTSLSDITSPISSDNLGSQEQFFPSVPSLPALVSGASSVSADPEGEMLQLPGVVQNPEMSLNLTAESTPETLTPPSLSKQVSAEVETPTPEPPEDAIILSPDVDDEGYIGDGDTVEDDDDSDSDEGLTMTRSKPKTQSPLEVKLDLKKIERRGTNASVGSTETAKKVMIDS
jgi:hypothetical protein